MFEQKLKGLEEDKKLRRLDDRESRQGARIVIAGREYLNFSSNDYLGLACHPLVVRKALDALNQYGFGSGASRLLSGGTRLHTELEQRTARFKGTPSSLLFNSGYAANTGAIPALSDGETALFSDEFNHASIIDGCRLSNAKTYVYRHGDMDHLETLLRAWRTGRNIVVTDTVFSMDGDIAPLPALAALCRKYDALLYLDEAHATGVMGEGKGVLAHFGMAVEPWIVQMGTFSKAMGSVGAFIAAPSDVILWTLNNARSFMYSTALPSCAAAASLAAFDVLEEDFSLIQRLWSNRKKMKTALESAGFDTMGSETPIIPVRTGSIEETIALSVRLREKGIYAPAIRPPTVKASRIRFTITAMHTDEDIEELAGALRLL